MTPRDEADLALYLATTSFGRSTFGAQLERALEAAYDSEGHRLRRAPPPELDAEGHPIRLERLSPWMLVRKGQEPTGYEPELGDVLPYARASRVFDRLASVDREAAAVLARYHGHQGARWERERLGRVWSLVDLTPAGKRRLGRLAEQRKEQGQPKSELQPLEQLALDEQLGRLRAHDSDAVWWRKALLEADDMLRRAVVAWDAVARTA